MMRGIEGTGMGSGLELLHLNETPQAGTPEEGRTQSCAGGGVTICCGLARSHYLAGAKPAQVAAGHGPGTETCSRAGNGPMDA